MVTNMMLGLGLIMVSLQDPWEISLSTLNDANGSFHWSMPETEGLFQDLGLEVGHLEQPAMHSHPQVSVHSSSSAVKLEV